MNNLTPQEQDLEAVTEAWKREIEEVKRLKEVNKKLVEVLEKSQQDINWMLNSREFLNQFVFDYLENAIKTYKS